MSKITFRKLAESDLPLRVKWFNDPEISQYLGNQIRSGTTLAIQKEWFGKYARDKSRKMFVIEIDGKPVGGVGLSDINLTDQNASLFIFIGEKEYWGSGVAKAALGYVTEYGFGKLKLHKIYLHVFLQNERAIGLYKKFGFTVEGEHKEMAKINGKYCDEIFMAKFNND